MKTLFLSIGHNNAFNWVFNGKKYVKSNVRDRGATGRWTTEFDEAKKIVDALVARGIPGIKLVKVPEQLCHEDRVAWINARVPNSKEYPEPFAMEFHLDAFTTPTATGTGVWYNDFNEYTKGEGRQFLAEYTNVTGLPSRGVNSDTVNRLKSLYFVSECKCASLLIELGFISNTKDLETIRAKGLGAIVSGIAKMNAS